MGRIQYAPTLPAEKTPGTQLDLSTRTRHLSLLDLSRFWRDLSFSCLDTGKRMRKENQGLTEAGEFGRRP